MKINELARLNRPLISKGRWPAKTLLVMKLTTILILGALLNVSAKGVSQNVSFEGKNVLLEKVFLSVKKQTGYLFFYDGTLLKESRPVTIAARNMPLESFLQKIFDGQPLKYSIENNAVIISRKQGVAIAANVTEEKLGEVASPFQSISGRVTASDGKALAGVNVLMKSSQHGTVTDSSGRYSINVTDPSSTLVFSYVGYDTYEVVVRNRTSIDVQLKEKPSSMNDIVIIGYGTVAKKDLTGSVSSLKPEQITSTPVTNVLETMQGKVAGVDLTRASGEAGAPMNITIRGNRSLNASNEPLILVDGIQYGSYIDINPNDVASIDVLKDASSTAIYGSRGANGVILITTKSGKGKTKIEANTYYGLNQLSDYDRQTNLDEYVTMTREAYRSIDKWHSPADDASIFGASYPNIQKGINTNWVDLMVHNGSVQSYHLALSGGNEKTSFRISSEYFNEKGFLKNDQLKRFVQHINFDHKITNNLKAGVVVNFNSSNQERRNTSFWNLMKGLPFGEPYNEDGTLKKYPWPATLDINPLLDESTDNYTNNTVSNRLFMVGFGEWTIVKDLSLRSSFAIDIFNAQQGIYEGANTTLSGGNNGYSKSSIKDSRARNWTWENVLNYNHNFKYHSLNAMIGTSMINNRATVFAGEGKNQTFATALFYNLGSNVLDIRNSSNLVQNQLASGFGRINYKFKNRYLLTASLRADGASVLADGNKWAYFPSAAAGWRISEESFMHPVKFVSNLKLRGSYGVSGNSAIQPYQTQGGLSRVPFAFDENPAIGYWPSIISNLTLGWEKTATVDFGLDFGFFNDRLTGSVDVYGTHTDHLLMERILPSVTGFNKIIDNVGKTKTKGIDIALSSRILSSGAFTWSADLNYSRFNEQIVELSVGGDDVSKGWFVGKPLNVFYDYEKVGIWQTSDKDQATVFGKIPGEIKVKDQNGDGKITATDDRVVLGQKSPKWTAGLTNNFSYKDFSLNILLYARFGQMISSDYAGSYYPGGLFNTAVVDYWTPENPTNAYPRPRVNVTDQYLQTLRYIDGSFLKIKDIRLMYNFTKARYRRMPLNNVALYVTAKNYFTFSKVKNYDPERGGSVDYPLTKQLVFGLNVAF